MGKPQRLIIAVATLIAVGLWFLSAPDTLSDSEAYAGVGNIEQGQTVFYAGGCASCHSAPKTTRDAKLLLTGGRAFASPFGTFYAPNISSDSEFGIGNWSNLDLANAMIKGVSPQGQHYYPAFPYTSYSRVRPSDIVDLRTFLNTLPASTAKNIKHDLPLPFRFRRALGLWKLIYLNDDAVQETEGLSRGLYLVEGLGHCAECHTPRTLLGGMQTTRWMAGAPLPKGDGRVPNITPHTDGLAQWSVADITGYLTSGFTPDFDSVSGLMVDVVENTAHLSGNDRLAIAEYLKALTPVAKP
ncbi:MAG: cytochrome c [Paracoccaceae bacterium]|jgi:mono/diheme cytochrome c family protein